MTDPAFTLPPEPDAYQRLLEAIHKARAHVIATDATIFSTTNTQAVDNLRDLCRLQLKALESGLFPLTEVPEPAAALAQQPAGGVHDIAARLVDELDGLVGESYGVSGLHLNGDVATWDDLLPGGRFERLSSLDELRAALARVQEGRAITALKVTLFGRACYLPVDIAEEVEHACAAQQQGQAVATVAGEFSEVRQDGEVYWLQTVLLKQPQQLPFGAPLYTTPPPSAVPEGWRPIESAPETSEVVLFCDSRGNRWTQCAHNWDIPECGLPATHWMPLPAAPEPGEGE